MELKVEDISPVQKEIHASVPAEQVAEAFNKVCQRVGKRAKVPGFRPGKVPRPMLMKIHGSSIHDEARSELVRNCWREALEKFDLHPISEPTFDGTAVEEGQAYSFKLSFDIRPNVEVKGYDGLEVTVEGDIPKVTDEQVDAELNGLQQQMAQLVPVEGRDTLQENDTAVIDFKGFLDGKPVQGGEAKDYKLKIGSHALVGDFETQLIGLKGGESRDVEVTFPEDYHAENLRAQKVRFEVQLKAIRQIDLPKIDDEFAKDLGKYETLAELKAEIRNRMQTRLDAAIGDEEKRAVLDKLVEQNPIEVPPTMLERQTAYLIHQMQHARSGKQEHDHENEPPLSSEVKNRLKESALRQVRSSLLLETVCKKENIDASDQDVNERVMKLAEGWRQPVQKVRAQLEKEDRIESLRYQIREEKAQEFLRSRAKITRKPHPAAAKP